MSAFRPIYLLKAAVLRGLGLVATSNWSRRRRRDAHRELGARAGRRVRGGAGWLAYTGLPPRDGLRGTEQREETIWVEHLPEGAIYVRYPAVFDIPQQAIDELDAMAGAPAERIILDLRQNPGGDNHNYANLLSHLTSPEIDRPGAVFVLTDRVTFSAAANFSTELEQKTQATSAGEAPAVA